MRKQESIGQGFVFAQQPQQQVFGLYIRRPELAGFIARKKDYAPRFLRIAFKHNALPPEPSGREVFGPTRPYLNPESFVFIVPCPQYSSQLCNQTATRPKCPNVFITLLKEPVEALSGHCFRFFWRLPV